MIVNNSELEKENGELCMVHGNLNITEWCVLGSVKCYTQWNFRTEIEDEKI